MGILTFFKVNALIIFFFCSFFHICYSQMSYSGQTIENYAAEERFVSNIAYKLPFRGPNYKFYGTLNYHIYGKAFASCKVHNAIVEAFHFCDQSACEAHFKILRCSSNKNGKIIPFHKNKNGCYAIFMTPLLNDEEVVKYYYRTGLFRFFKKYDKSGKFNKHISIDFENTAFLFLQLDNAAKMYGLRIKKIIINRFFLDELYSTSFGDELKERDIYFAKYLSKRVNKKYDDLFYVEFETDLN